MSSAPDEDQAAELTPGDGAAWPAFPADRVQPRPLPASAPPPAARRPWSAWREIRVDVRLASVVVVALAAAGFPVALLWWALAPRASYRITVDGPQPIGHPSDELRAADDAIFVLLLAAVGLLAGVFAWSLLRRRRGVAMLLALALGTAATAVIAWQFGHVLGPEPSHAQLTQVGAQVTTGLTLRSLPALAAGPFCAVLAHVVAALLTRRDDLGRTYLPPPVLGRAEPAPSPLDPQPSGGPRS